MRTTVDLWSSWQHQEAPYRTLAEEQLVLIELKARDRDGDSTFKVSLKQRTFQADCRNASHNFLSCWDKRSLMRPKALPAGQSLSALSL